jgi:bifunctional enzyme CysN/CysC
VAHSPVLADAGSEDGVSVSPNVVWEPLNVPRAQREERNGHQAAVLWFTGLPGSGKSSIARAVETLLFDLGHRTMFLDGDQVRHGLNGDLGFSADDRRENIRRVGEVARLFFEQGSLVLCTFVSPFREDRERVRRLVPDGRFIEIFVDTPVDECERRDPKGLYARARRGEISDMTGISSPYDAPEVPAIRIDTLGTTVEEAAAVVVERLRQRGLIPQTSS